MHLKLDLVVLCLTIYVSQRAKAVEVIKAIFLDYLLSNLHIFLLSLVSLCSFLGCLKCFTFLVLELTSAYAVFYALENDHAEVDHKKDQDEGYELPAA